VIPAASLVRVSSFPSLRNPVSAARTLCACQPTFAELMRRNGVFAELYHTQFYNAEEGWVVA
jgi:hypothetical protein